MSWAAWYVPAIRHLLQHSRWNDWRIDVLRGDEGKKASAPLLHNITVEDLKAKYPDVGDIQCISTDKYSKDQVTVLLAKELIKRYK